MRVPLADGQWAELRERLMYGQAKPIRAVFARVEKGGEASALAELDLELVRGYVESWNVLDFEGNAVPLDQPELAPDDAIQTIALAAIDIWRGAQVRPKAGIAKLNSTRRERRSA